MFQSTASERKKFLHERNRLWVDDKLKTLIPKEVLRKLNSHEICREKDEKKICSFKPPKSWIYCVIWLRDSEICGIIFGNLSIRKHWEKRRETWILNRDLSWTWYDKLNCETNNFALSTTEKQTSYLRLLSLLKLWIKIIKWAQKSLKLEVFHWGNFL